LGLVIFAAVLLGLIGFFNLTYGIAAVANSHLLAGNAHYVRANLRTWGWITLIIGVVQMLAAVGVFTGSQLAGGLPVGAAVGSYGRCGHTTARAAAYLSCAAASGAGLSRSCP
jgi:hypothetical protein